MKSYDVTILMKALCMYCTTCFSKFHRIKFGNLVKICFWLNLAVKGSNQLQLIDTPVMPYSSSFLSKIELMALSLPLSITSIVHSC